MTAKKTSKSASKQPASKAVKSANPASSKGKSAKAAPKAAPKAHAKPVAAKAAAMPPMAPRKGIPPPRPGGFNSRPIKPGRGAPPPKIGRAAMGKPPLVAKAPKPASARKPSRQRVRICKQENCNDPQTTQGFCRLHYLQNWRTLKDEKAKRAQKNLDRYVERMAGAKKPAAAEDGEEGSTETKSEEQVFEEDFGEFVDVLSREENLDKILNGIKVEDY